ncbi:hypothetical protein CVT24_000565 [Panaeolus cyanescens]|uniref:Peptidase A1 domain-containing protein n=1 Tax=Panaeolus cyanescens TaxID=181874 RepID=A0A409W7H5_9AGAR|nr:hypothetical protein CVT24_000565 [Panaeolus cyanescens]
MSSGLSSDVADRLSVIVDSSSPMLRYEGEWVDFTPTSDMMDSSKVIEPPFSDILRQAPPNKVVSLSHKFTGSRIQVQGTLINPHNATNWKATCTVDGRDMELDIAFDSRYNLYPFCEGRYLSTSNPHVLNFTIEVLDDQTGIWFDRLAISPANPNDLDFPLVVIPHTDPMIEYTGPENWTDFLTGQLTNVPNSKAIVNFNGTALRWYTLYESEFSADRSQTRGTLIIDDSTNNPISFVIPEVKPNVDVQMGELLFRTPELTPGLHRAEVVYEVIGRPLGLHHLVIENAAATSSSSSTTTANGDLTVASSAPASKMTKNSKIGLGVGVGLGVVVILALLLFVFRKRRRQTQTSEQQSARPFSPPFFSSPPNSPLRPVSAATTISSKGTPVSQLPFPRQSLQLRTIQYPEENPPPYQVAQPVK